LGEGEIGEGYAKILESSALSISRDYAAIWKKDAIDLTELAHKRWIEKWTMDRIAAHFGCGRTAVVRHIGRLRANPELIEDGVARSRVKSRKHRFMGA
jgi:hypothetical protein